MHTENRSRRLIIVALFLTLGVSPLVSAQRRRSAGRASRDLPVLWRDPGNIRARDLRFGPGSENLAPVAPYTFIEEDKSGESPKFEIRDAQGIEWRVKLGPEAQSETVATRLVWAVGYFAEEAYYMERVRIKGLPRLSRGRQYVENREFVRGARFEPRRKGVTRGGEWDWDKNPFTGKRELSGLKVIMILLNNYDARKANNRVFYVERMGRRLREARYTVSDLGATLGRAGGLGGKRSKNNLKDFLSTEFVKGVEDDGSVEFDYDTRPTRLGMFTVFYPPYYRGEVKKEASMRGIPVAHARWIGSLLSQLTDSQLRDAFNAAGYDEETREGFIQTLRERITQLTRL
jgi:hypothetical protein